jgi:exodeoxyribonuclease V alpha subunit
VAANPEETLNGLIERVTFHNAETGFCVLKVKVKGHKDLIVVVVVINQLYETLDHFKVKHFGVNFIVNKEEVLVNKAVEFFEVNHIKNVPLLVETVSVLLEAIVPERVIFENKI